MLGAVLFRLVSCTVCIANFRIVPMSLGLLCGGRVLHAHERLGHQRDRPAHDGHVSDVEGGPVPAVQVKVDVVDNVPARGAVERVAQCAAQNEAVRKAFRFAQRPGEQPCEPCRYCERDRQKKPPLPAARASKEAERRAGIESVN